MADRTQYKQQPQYQVESKCTIKNLKLNVNCSKSMQIRGAISNLP